MLSKRLKYAPARYDAIKYTSVFRLGRVALLHYQSTESHKAPPRFSAFLPAQLPS